ncbi:glycosyltransferase family 2 protein [Aliihoeflea sp. 40Bstr573]|uniref:glycosyltransferase family 2 protein n=1 Tax=Aliihoeflea sp. 40Bstr573 TaxID=2696467 RepID=UPI0020940DC1|nr:glycosyltransferase family 2 protein [Aliihoeflea sp. 40Bstr573]MCO6387499.1 glycosyltransferase [Aliihoeflea sp. 40Bstr573]
MNGPERRPRESQMPLISIAIPVYNEALNMDALYRRLTGVAERMSDRCRMEFVFSDNNSTDDTWSRIEAFAASDARVRAIRFSKNVGFQRSIMANYLHTRGDAVMQIDADLQDPPEMLEQFFEVWQKGFDVVYGVRRKRREAAWMNQFRRFGYWMINAISEHDIPRDVGDFRLVDRKVIRALSQMRTPNPYLRGMIAGLGFRQTGLEYERDARVAGESKFGLSRLLRLGLTAVFNHSSVPLRMASILGIMMIAVSAMGTIYFVLLKILQPELPQGLASMHVLVLFGIGLQSLLLGIIGEYILRIYLMLRAEPLAIVDSSINIEPAELVL